MYDFELNLSENLALVYGSGMTYLIDLKKTSVFSRASGFGNHECIIDGDPRTIYETVMIKGCMYDKIQFLLKYA